MSERCKGVLLRGPDTELIANPEESRRDVKFCDLVMRETLRWWEILVIGMPNCDTSGVVSSCPIEVSLDLVVSALGIVVIVEPSEFLDKTIVDNEKSESPLKFSVVQSRHTTRGASCEVKVF